MTDKIYIGTFRPGSRMETPEGVLLLTQIPPQAAQSPESAALEIPPDQVGKLAVVRGDLSGDVLYSAEIVEVAPPLLGRLVELLLRKGLVTEEEWREVLEPEAPRQLCALVIGHKKASPGAVNRRTGLTEFAFNENLAMRIERQVQKVHIQRVYRRTYRELPDDINALGPDFIVSLHCNAFDGRASGTEVLYYHRSEKGRRMAGILQRHLVRHLGLPDRGVKPRTVEDRGGYLLRYTEAPCVIAEPFFIDNDGDLARAQEDLDGLASAYARAIEAMAGVV